MSIENINQIQTVENDLFGDYGLNGVSLESSTYANETQTAAGQRFGSTSIASGSNQYYSIPLVSVKNECKNTISLLKSFVFDLDNILSQVNLNPDASPTLDETHMHIWSEILTEEDKGYSYPSFVSYQEYLYAEEHKCRGCRKFIKEYNKLISTTTFGHLFIFRKIVLGLINESVCIMDSLEEDFSLDYENESQQQVAAYYSYWLKMATHYQKLFAQTIPSRPTLLPESEVDQINKRQAAQFQAFFSIRVNSETVSIDNQLQSLLKDLTDDCNVFYSQFISPALKFKTKVIEDLSLDMKTTNMLGTLPKLAEEAITAMLTVEGNFKSILTDMLERRNLMIKKIDSLYQSILLRRKYVLYISQLASKALSRNKIVTEEYDEKYVDKIKNIILNREYFVETMKSNHSALAGLEEDSHPQYLLRSGGRITGNIDVDEGVSIDGVQISQHSHDGSDGTPRIKSIDIDYDSARELNRQGSILSINEELNVSIDSFSTDVLPGGTPVTDAIIAIEIPDYLVDRYDFEILYTEI